MGMRGGTLTGEVRLPSGAPAAGIRVAALEAPVLADGEAAPGSVLAGLAMTDAVGRYRLEDVPPGRYFVVAGELDNLVYRPTPVTLADGTTIDGLNFSMSDQYDGAIEVVVHLTGSSQVVPGSLVSIRSVDGGYRHNRTVATNFEGLVSFSGIPYGDYTVSTPAPAMRDLIAGVTPQPGAAQRELSLQVSINPERQKWRVSLGLQRPAQISGTVRDSAGNPVLDALVESLTTGYRNGRDTFESASSTRTDRFGEYTLPAAAGERYIRVTPSIENALKDAVTYYPSTGDPGRAKPVAAGNGTEVKDVNFQLAKGFKVSGVVAGVGADATVPAFFLMSRGGMDAFNPPVANDAAAGGGVFEISGIPAGAWDLYPIVHDSAWSRPRTGRIPIDVVDKGLEGLSIAVNSGLINGRVIVNGAKLDLDSTGISLVPRESLPLQLSGTLPVFEIPDSNGNFSFLNVPALTFGVQVSGLPMGWYVSDLRVAGGSVFNDNTFSLSGDAPLSMEVIVTSGAGRVEGTVAGIVGSVQLPASAQVILVPDAPRRQNFLLYRTAEVLPDRSFTIFPHVAPGNYKIFALPRLPASRPELNPGFIAKYEDAAVSITVVSGQVVRRDLALTPVR
jgi:hypothetical protein